MPISFDFLDGFDYQDFENSEFKYTGFTARGQGAVLPGRGGASQSGAGRSLELFNTGFGSVSHTKILTPRNIWYWGFAFKAIESLGNPGMGTGIFQRWESGPSVAQDANSFTELAIKQVPIDSTTAFWRLYTGGNGTNSNPGSLIADLPQVFVQDVWYYVEFIVRFGPHGGLEMWVDDVLVHQDLNLNIGLANPDRFTRRWQSFGFTGYVMDDLYIAHGGRPGPLRISAHFPTADGAPLLWTPSAGSSHCPLVNEGTPGYGGVLAAPDGDLTYVGASGAGVQDFYQFGSDPCWGKILAIAVNACGRKVAGVSPGIDLMAKTPDGAISTVGNFALPSAMPTPPYYTGQAITEVSMVDGAVWTDRDLKNTLWGVQSSGLGSSRVTQVFLEKVVTLSGAAFDCGAQSYAY